jgi:hypothetical protein
MDTLAMEPPAQYQREAPPADASIHGRIHVLRWLKVMLDRDLAELYGVPVRQLKQAVRRNRERFPEDFMFQLTTQEAEASRSQFATLNHGPWDDTLGPEGVSRSQTVTLKQGHNVKYAPFAFTEHGILMLANVLRSERAIAVSIHIIRVFARMREAMADQQEVLRKIDQLEAKVIGHDADLQDVFRKLKELISPSEGQRPRIGFEAPGTERSK